ncbi:hypothetical protein [Anabaena azotica]|uniref:hypothetical protein n=1 Tax=Anabaena azotica TaxID=197653 RepID=UPI0039A6F740
MNNSFNNTITTHQETITSLFNPVDFVKREWLLEKIERHFKENPGKQHLIIVGEPGSGKTAYLAHLANHWNCPRHFIRFDAVSSVTGIDPRSFLLSIGSQLYEKYGEQIFDEAGSLDVSLTGDSITQGSDVNTVIIKNLFRLPWQKPLKANVKIELRDVSNTKVTGVQIQNVVNTALALDEETLLHLAVLDPIKKIQNLPLKEEDKEVTILINALDELSEGSGKSILDVIPRYNDDFPNNLRLVMTTRPMPKLKKIFYNPQDFIDFENHKEEVSADIKEYIQKHISEDILVELVNVINDKKDKIIAKIQEKSDNNFLYLYHFFEQVIQDGKLNIDNIPQGLDGIYGAFVLEKICKDIPNIIKFGVKFTDGTPIIPRGLITAWEQDKDNIVDVKRSECGTKVTVIVKNPDTIDKYLSDKAKKFSAEIEEIIFINKRRDAYDWVKNYLPIVGILAVAKEALTHKQIANFSTIDEGYVSSIIITIKQFLKEIEGDTAFSYRFYHNSLKEYLLDNKRNRDYPLTEKDYHNKIASFYEKESNSWKNIDLIDQYGLLHLPQHLAAAGREEELYTLLTASPDWMNRKRDIYKSDRPYVNDLELAIAKFNDPVPPDQLLNLIKLYTARLVVQQRANAYENTDLSTLIWLGREPNEVLSYARLRTNPDEKLKDLLIIYNALQDTKQSNSNVLYEASSVLKEATEVARNEIENNSWSIQSLRNLVIALIEDQQLTEAEEILEKIRNDSFKKVEVLGELATALKKSGNSEKANNLFKQAEDITDKIKDSDFNKFKVLLYLATALVNTGDMGKASDMLSLAKDVLKKVDWGEKDFREAPTLKKVEGLLDLAKAFDHAGETKNARLIFNEVHNLANANTVQDWEKSEILINLAISQTQSGEEFANEGKTIFNTLEEIADKITDNELKAESLASLANALAKGGNEKDAEELFEKAINILNFIAMASTRVEILREFAESLVKGGLTEKAFRYFLQAQEATKDITHEFVRSKQLRKLAIALVQSKYTDQARKAFSEAEELAPKIEKGQQTEPVLTKWAVILVEAGFKLEAIAICPNLENDNFYIEAKKKMDKIREDAKSYTENEARTKKQAECSQAINQAENSAKMRDIDKIAIKSEYLIGQKLGDDNFKNDFILKDLAEVVAWLGDFKEALFTIRGVKHGLIQFLYELGNWIWASDTIDQKLSLEILQDTTRIFGWTYPYWGKISNQLFSESK